MVNILQEQSSGSNSSSATRTQAITILQSLYNAKIFSDIKDDSHRIDANGPKQFLDNNKIFKYSLVFIFNHNLFSFFLDFYHKQKKISFQQ
jgi:hypothetical protein